MSSRAKEVRRHFVQAVQCPVADIEQYVALVSPFLLDHGEAENSQLLSMLHLFIHSPDTYAEPYLAFAFSSNTISSSSSTSSLCEWANFKVLQKEQGSGITICGMCIRTDLGHGLLISHGNTQAAIYALAKHVYSTFDGRIPNLFGSAENCHAFSDVWTILVSDCRQIIGSSNKNEVKEEEEDAQFVDIQVAARLCTYQLEPSQLMVPPSSSQYLPIEGKNDGDNDSKDERSRWIWRRTTPSDQELVLEWFIDFQTYLGQNQQADGKFAQIDRDKALETVQRKLSLTEERNGPIGWYLLIVGDVPVSLAGCSGETLNGARIGPVYTPKEHRKHGYASYLTYLLVKHILSLPKKSLCFLYADLDYPTSNKIYQQIGFKPVMQARLHKYFYHTGARVLAVQRHLRQYGLAAVAEVHNLKVSRHPDYKNLVLLKYKSYPAGSRFDDRCRINRNCRGIILDENDDWKVVCMPYERFFNFGEKYASAIDWQSACVYEKLDGSIMTMYPYQGKWHVSSSGSPNAGGSVSNPEFSKQLTLSKLFFEILSTNHTLPPVPTTDRERACFMFEMMSDRNPLLTDPGPDRIVLHGARDLYTLKELDPRKVCQNYGFEMCEHHALSSLEECREKAQTLNPAISEGFVVCDAHFRRIKVKCPAFVSLGHLSINGSVAHNAENMLKVIRVNESDEFLAYFPEFLDLYQQVNAHYLAFVQKVAHVLAWSSQVEGISSSSPNSSLNSNDEGVNFVLEQIRSSMKQKEQAETDKEKENIDGRTDPNDDKKNNNDTHAAQVKVCLASMDKRNFRNVIPFILPESMCMNEMDGFKQKKRKKKKKKKNTFGAVADDVDDFPVYDYKFVAPPSLQRQLSGKEKRQRDKELRELDAMMKEFKQMDKQERGKDRQKKKTSGGSHVIEPNSDDEERDNRKKKKDRKKKKKKKKKRHR